MWNSVAAATVERARCAIRSTPQDLTAAIQITAGLLTAQRGTRPFDYLSDPLVRAGYLAGYLVPNALRIQHIVDRERPFAAAPQRILDLGAGPLSASIGLLLSTAGTRVRQIVALDTCEKALLDGKAIVQAIAPQVEVTLVTGSAIGRRARLPDGPFQAVLVANLLSEVKGRPDAIAGLVRDLVGAALQRCAEDGCVLLLEPGTRLAARNLMQLRDELDPATVTILAPCTGAARCPLRGRDSWCHAAHALTLPEPVAELRRAAGLTGLELNDSYLALAPRPQPAPADQARLVSDVMVDGARRLRYACTARGLVTIEWQTGDAVGSLASAPRGGAVPGASIAAWRLPERERSHVREPADRTARRGRKRRGGANR